MTDMICATSSDEESTCGRPCHPDNACDECAGYWHEMEAGGYWDGERKCWTDKGMKEMCK